MNHGRSQPRSQEWSQQRGEGQREGRVSGNLAGRGRECGQRMNRERSGTETLESGRNRPSSRSVGVALRGEICVAYSGTVIFGHEALRLPCPGGGRVLHTRVYARLC